VLLDATTHLPDGLRIRVRLPHAGDRPGLHDLHLRVGVEADDLELSRALRFDPRARAVACATAWLDGAEVLVGYGAIDRGAERPDLLISDEAAAPGVRDVLARALQMRAGSAQPPGRVA
jgi:hypothetical protein